MSDSASEHDLPEKRELFREQWRDFFVDFLQKARIGFYSREYKLFTLIREYRRTTRSTSLGTS